LNLLNLINETRATIAKGSKEGRTKGLMSGSKSHVQPSKSRVKNYRSITDALSKGYVGQMFTTTGADRIYVTTVRKWGKDPEQMRSGRVAKGFNGYKAAEKYSRNTFKRHGHLNQGKKNKKDK